MANGVITIATGRYDVFVEPLISALTEHGFCDRLFVLTDNETLLKAPVQPGLIEVNYLPHGRLPWPYPTLWRYHAIASYERVLRDSVTHLTYMDVDMRPLTSCPELTQSELFAVQHPGFWNSSPTEATFSRDIRSRAYHDPSPEDRYVAGGVQGGATDAFLSACRDCAHAIETDFRLGVMAVWHDESHWNHYVNSRSDVALFGPEYCWPESSTMPEALDQPRILALDKDHHGMRGTKVTMSERFNRAPAVQWAGRMRNRLRAGPQS